MLPRGVRNNNPGNLERNGIKWLGMSNIQDDDRFVRFDHPKYGLRALMKIIHNYYHRLDLKNIQGIINRYAPPNENNTGAYVQAVADHVGVKTLEKINLGQSNLISIAQAIVRHENGNPLKYPNYICKNQPYWYTDDLYVLAAKMVLERK